MRQKTTEVQIVDMLNVCLIPQKFQEFIQVDRIIHDRVRRVILLDIKIGEKFINIPVHDMIIAKKDESEERRVKRKFLRFSLFTLLRFFRQGIRREGALGVFTASVKMTAARLALNKLSAASLLGARDPGRHRFGKFAFRESGTA